MSNIIFDTKSVPASLLKCLKRYSRDESGSTAIEYGLTAALISVLIISGASAIGGDASKKFTEVSKLFSGPEEFPRASSRGRGP